MNSSNQSPTQIADHYQNKLDATCEGDIDDVVCMTSGALRIKASGLISADLRALHDAFGKCSVTRVGGRLEIRTSEDVVELAGVN